MYILYSLSLTLFLGVITSYLLIKQFKMNKNRDGSSSNNDDDDDNEQNETRFRQSTISSKSSFDIVTLRRETPSELLPTETFKKSNKILENQHDIDLEKNKDSVNRFSDGVLSSVTAVNPSIDLHYTCPNCLIHLPSIKDRRPSTQ
jgi:hypothetical protein